VAPHFRDPKSYATVGRMRTRQKYVIDIYRKL
jgi:hypothetical protein